MTPPRQRRDRGSGAIYKTAAGQWRAAIDLGYGANGKRRRKVVSSRDKATVVRKLRELQRQVEDHGDVPTAGWTVDRWLKHWLTDIAAPRLRPKTRDTYRGYIDNWLIPLLGKRRLDTLQPQHIRAAHHAMLAERADGTPGLSSTSALQAHRILVKALNDARSEGVANRNPAELVDAPRRAVSTREGLTKDQAVTLLRSLLAGGVKFAHGCEGTCGFEHAGSCPDRCTIPNGRTKDDDLASRWAAALLAGPRQGEALGLEIDRVHFATEPGELGWLDLSWQLQRLKFSHGCDGTCGRKRAGSCPDRKVMVPAGFEHRHLTGGLYLTRPKSRAGTRVVPMAPPFEAVLRRHLDAAPTNPHGLVWATVDGKPIDPSDDSAAWHQALAAAGLPSTPLHAARHTTATLLLAAGVDAHVIASILGHSEVVTTRGYQHVGQTMQADAMRRLTGLLAVEG